MLHILVSAYERPIHLRILIDSFLVQTNPNWSMTVIHDGKPSKEASRVMSFYDDKRIFFLPTEEREKLWGNSHRQVALQLINGNRDDFVLMTNGDNYYVPFFVEKMMSQTNPKVGMVYCDFLHHNFGYDILRSEIAINHIDIGAYIVQIHIAQKIGFNDITRSDADGNFAIRCAYL